MKLAVFAKKKQTKDGRPFTAYVGKLTKKDGSDVYVEIKFREECGAPKPEMLPAYVVFDKAEGNLSTRTYTDKEGNEGVSYRLWLSGWRFSDEKYEDHSLDEFE